jgi:lipopolysaccharide export system permease protein
MIGQTWERYIYREIFKLFWLILIISFFLYVIIDFSSRGSSYGSDLTLQEFSLLYLANFSNELDLFIPFALLISTIRILCQMNVSHEIVALLAGGISIRRILLPFLISGMLTSTLVLINYETVHNAGQKYLKKIKDRQDPTGRTQKAAERIKNLLVRDDSILFYQHYDTSRDRFFDVLWFRSFNEVVRMKYLYPHPEHSEGANIDFLIRGNDDRFKKVNSMNSQVFQELGFEEEILGIVLNNPDNQSISTLWSRLPSWDDEIISDKDAQILTAFHFKLAIPFLCLLVVLGPAPYCVRFGRQIHIFMIFGGAIFCFVAFMTVMDAMAVLGENQVIYPTLAVWAPMVISLTYSGIQFMRIRS